MKKKKPSRRYLLSAPRLLNLPRTIKQPTMIHYHYLSGFGKPSELNDPPQPSFHSGGNEDNSNDELPSVSGFTPFPEGSNISTEGQFSLSRTPLTFPSNVSTITDFERGQDTLRRQLSTEIINE